MRVVNLDMTDPNHHCPPGFVTINSPRRTCGSPEIDGCVSATFPVHSVRYNRVCGYIKAYQYKTPDTFEYYYRFRNRGIDDPYVEGVSLIHGSSPTYDTLDWCLHSLATTISVKQEVVIIISSYSTLQILFGMARVVALKAPAAVSIIHLGSVSDCLNQPLMISS